MPTRIHRPSRQPLARELVDAWGGVPTTIAADLLQGRTLVDPALHALRPFSGSARLVGPAVTAWCQYADYGAVHHAIAEAQAGDVIVIAAGGRMDAAMIGELLSGAARLKKVAGVVVDGAVRDVGTLVSWPDFPVFARGRTARGPSSMERGSVNETVVFGGVPVTPGDLILGDDDGLVVVPRGEAAARLQAAQAMVRAEEGWEARLATGAGTVEVFNVPAAEIVP
ncbi:MAG: RraA family protein [Geminicoccaceae bacterium]